jgi:hypothetical protein
MLMSNNVLVRNPANRHYPQYFQSNDDLHHQMVRVLPLPQSLPLLVVQSVVYFLQLLSYRYPLSAFVVFAVVVVVVVDGDYHYWNCDRRHYFPVSSKLSPFFVGLQAEYIYIYMYPYNLQLARDSGYLFKYMTTT